MFGGRGSIGPFGVSPAPPIAHAHHCDRGSRDAPEGVVGCDGRESRRKLDAENRAMQRGMLRVTNAGKDRPRPPSEEAYMSRLAYRSPGNARPG